MRAYSVSFSSSEVSVIGNVFVGSYEFGYSIRFHLIYSDKIFSQAGGYWKNTTHNDLSEYGEYWVTTILTNDPSEAYFLMFSSNNPTFSIYWVDPFRYKGLSIRSISSDQIFTAEGTWHDTAHINIGSYGWYWSNTIYAPDTSIGWSWYINFYSNNINMQSGPARTTYYGSSIRSIYKIFS